MSVDRFGLTDHDYEAAGWFLGVGRAEIRAVATVEAGPYGAFLATGEPVVLVERHVFHRRTGGRWSATHPHISNPEPGGYGRVSEQHGRLAEAAALDREAALESTSFGLFQVMGFNWGRAGYGSLQDLVNGMFGGDVAEHLRAFVGYVRSNPALRQAIQRHEWATVAELYNGRDYRRNRWDEKIAAAFAAELADGTQRA